MNVPEEVERLLRRHVAGLTAAPIGARLPLGTDGLGLDSVAIVELLLECESVFDVKLPEQLAEGERLTLAALVSVVEQAVRHRDTVAS